MKKIIHLFRATGCTCNIAEPRGDKMVLLQSFVNYHEKKTRNDSCPILVD